MKVIAGYRRVVKLPEFSADKMSRYEENLTIEDIALENDDFDSSLEIQN